MSTAEYIPLEDRDGPSKKRWPLLMIVIVGVVVITLGVTLGVVFAPSSSSESTNKVGRATPVSCSSSNRCGHGVGDCNGSSSNCKSGTSCYSNRGERFGYAADVDVCIGAATLTCSGSSNIVIVPPSTSKCLTRSSNSGTIVLSGNKEKYRNKDYPNYTLFDARNAKWPGIWDNEYVHWIITLRETEEGSQLPRKACWYGGVVCGAWDDTDPSVTWEDPYHHSGAITIDTPNFYLEGMRVHGQGDGIRTYGDKAYIRRVYVEDIHDDCVENDDLHNVDIRNSFFDGCFSGFSARTHRNTPDSVDGTDNVFSVRNTLMRMKPQIKTYKPEKYGSPGHGGFWKWDEKAPKVVIRNSIFMAEQPASHQHLGIPSEMTVLECSNNVMVWLGEGPFPDADKLPSCFTVTTDRAAWDNAVERWWAGKNPL